MGDLVIYKQYACEIWAQNDSLMLHSFESLIDMRKILSYQKMLQYEKQIPKF